MPIRRITAALALIALITTSCGGDSDDDSSAPSAGDDTASSDDDGSADTVDPADVVYELPPELADFPLPEGAVVTAEPVYFAPDADPRETLAAGVSASGGLDATVQTISDGLESAGYVVVSEEITATGAAWEFTKDGLPGAATVREQNNAVLITINLFMSGVG